MELPEPMVACRNIGLQNGPTGSRPAESGGPNKLGWPGPSGILKTPYQSISTRPLTVSVGTGHVHSIYVASGVTDVKISDRR